jgi:hypothetical protein
LLFNIDANCLIRIVIKVQQNNLITELISNLIPKGIAILQYVDVDGTIMCLDHGLEKARKREIAFIHV